MGDSSEIQHAASCMAVLMLSPLLLIPLGLVAGAFMLVPWLGWVLLVLVVLGILARR